jgi:acid stress-induced BolA-like protein IbaG/YrbA
MCLHTKYRKHARELILSMFLILISKGIIAQQNVASTTKTRADSFYAKKDYANAAAYYEKYLLYETGSVIDHDYILLAHSFYKAGNHEKAIWALSFLVKSFIFSECQEIQFYFKHTIVDTNLQYIETLKKCECNRIGKSRAFKSDVAGLLDSIYMGDQVGRSIVSNPGLPWRYIDNTSSLHLIDSIYKKYGWLSKSEVGPNASMAQFLVIQHSNLESQVKRQDRVKNAVQNCLIEPDVHALLLDRISVQKGEKQL